MQSPHVRSQVGFGFSDRRGESFGSGTERDVMDDFREVGPLFWRELVLAERVDRRLGEFPELVVGEVFQRHRDDLDIGRKLGLIQVGQTGYQLAFGQVPRRAEQDDDVGVERRIGVAARACLWRRIRDGLRFVGGHSPDTSTAAPCSHR